MRNSLSFFAKISLTLLVVGLIVPLQSTSATSVTLVTKTFTVHDRNDQPIANALVQMHYIDTSTNPNDYTYTAIVLTNSSGIAQISLPQNEQNVQAQVEPALGDVTNAIYTTVPYGSGALDSAADSAIAVKLQPAGLSLHIVQPSGSDAPLTTSLNYPLPSGGSPTTYAWLLRPGSFGIALDPSLGVGNNYTLNVSPPFTLVNQFPHTYGLKVTAASPAPAPVVYTNVLNTTPLTADSNGTYTLMTDAGNIEGQLKTPGGANLTLSGTLGQSYLQIQKLNTDGSFDYSQNSQDLGANNYSLLDSSGHFYARIRGLLAGRYAVVVLPGGSTTIPVFRTDLWVNASGGFSLTEGGTYSTTEPFVLNLAVPTPNLVLHTVLPGSSTADPSYLDISQGSSGTFVSSDFIQSVGSFALPDGNFVLTDNSFSGGVPAIFNVTILSGVVTLTDSAHHTLTPASDGSYSISLAPPIPPNFLYHLQDSAGAAVANQFLNACPLDASANCVNGAIGPNSTSDGSGNGGLYFDNGSYQIFINPSGDSSLAQANYRVTVVNGVVTTIDPSAIADGSGRDALTIPTANLRLKIVNPLNLTVPLANGYVNVCNGHPGPCPAAGSTSNGFANFYLADGSYSMGVMDFTPNTTFVQNNYQVLVSNGVVSFVGQTPPLDILTHRFLVSPSTSNLLLHIQDPNTAASIAGAYSSFCVFVNNQTTNCVGSGQSDQSGNIAAYLIDGTYKLTVYPGPNSSLSSRVYDVTVSGGGTSINIAGSTLVSGYWVVTPAQANVVGTFVDESGHPLVFSGNQGLSVQLQKQDANQNWIYQNANAWRVNPTWGFNISVAGNYRVVASPYGFSDYATTFSDPFAFDPSVVQPSIPIVFRASNLKLLIHNPLDNSLLRSGSLQIEQLFSDHSNWISNSSIDYSNPGLASAFLNDGNYRLTVLPPQGSDSIVGLANKIYLATVSSNGTTVSVTDGATPISADPTTQRFSLSAASANITARVVDSAGAPIPQTPGTSISVNVQRWNPTTGNWEYFGLWTQANNDGFVGISIHEAGQYRLQLYPYGLDGVVNTTSTDFTITSLDSSTFTKSFGDIPLSRPSILVKVVLSGSGQTVTNVGVEVRKNGEWLDWANSGANGVVPIALSDAGSFEFVVHPARDGSSGEATAKSYTITAVKDGTTGAITASADGISAVNGVFSLPLGTATLSGTVKDPLGNLLTNSQVIAIDSVTNQELWQSSVSSDQNGAWAMALPAGSYKLFVQAPWGNAQFGNSDLVGDFTVGANGFATGFPNGLSATSVTLTLKSPTWSGIVKSPDGLQVIPQASVCYRINSAAEVNCSSTDDQGKFAISAPTGFSTFDNSSFLQIREGSNPQYSELNFQGATAVLGVLGLSGSNILLKLGVPNVAVTVTAGGIPVANTWVSFERDGVGWLGGGITDAQGVSKITIPNPELGFSARAEVGGSSLAGSYSPTRAVFPAAALTGGVYVAQFALATPNLRGILREPSPSGAVLAPFSSINLFDDSNGSFITSVNVDSTGFFSLNAPAPSSGVVNYTLAVYPQWNGTSSNSSQKYELSVDSSGNTTVTLKSSGQSVPTETRAGISGTIYSFSLAAPSVVGVVFGPNGSTPQSNSWINAIDVSNGQYVNTDGGDSRLNGGFSLPLADGTYDLQAHAPWGSANTSNSAPCRVIISGSQVTSGTSSCVQADKSIHLELRAPNLSFTVVDGAGAVVPYASAFVWSGSWNRWAQSDQNGQISLFIDSDAIKTATRSTDGTSLNLHISVDPPYGDSSINRWQCDSTQLSSNCLNIPNVTIGQAYPITSLSSPLSFSTPNLKVREMLPDGLTPAGIGGWVNIYQIPDLTHPNNKNWITGGTTDSQGYAAFTIDSTLTNLVVEVNPPNSKRTTVASKTYSNNSSGYSVTGLNNLSFDLGSPNLKLTVKGGSDEVNKFGGITIEKLESGNSYSWLGNFNLDELGKLSLLLPSSGVFKITMVAGAGSSGAQTVCSVNTDGSGVVSTSLITCPDGLLTLDSLAVKLSSGNVVGTVLAPNSTSVQGATVYANVHNALNDTTAVITTTTATGRFGLNLDPTLQWDLRIFPPQAGSGQVQLAKLLSGPSVPVHISGTITDLGSIALAIL